MTPAINYEGGRVAVGAGGLILPTIVASDRWGPNFQFIPEPTTIGLLGLGALLMLRRRR